MGQSISEQAHVVEVEIVGFGVNIMANKLKCCVCKKIFYGPKHKKFCSKDCKNKKRRDLRNVKSIEEKRKEDSRRYYLKTKYPLTKKYKKQQEEIKRKKRENCKNWNRNNKEKSSIYRKIWKEKSRQWFDEYKKTLKCDFCGYNKCTEALDFHHKNPQDKKFNIGQGVGKRYNKERILKEIAKCFALCANCHRELHYKEEREKTRKNREIYLKIVNISKKTYYSIIERELQKDWVKKLQDKAKYNLDRFGGNQHIKIDNGIKEKIDVKKILSKKTEIGERTVSRAIQIYKRGTEDQKTRAREGKDSIYKIHKEMSSIRYSRKVG